jgi:hypothetical protein
MWSDSISSDSLVVAAHFAAVQPGWIERVRSTHIARADGTCAGCGTYRPTPWPCVLLYIARSAEHLVVDNPPPTTALAQPHPDALRPSSLRARRSPPAPTPAAVARSGTPDAA